tara:strand:+ start:320 stop:469 length:150 start_codon:yes stop_codon:yes gene_type:complete
MKIGIIGNSFVGESTRQVECKEIEIVSYDINPVVCIPKGFKFRDMLDCE